jgi:hypothetical protein
MAIVLLGLSSICAQEKPANEARLPEVPLKIQIVLSEFDGAQKISTLPYTLSALGTSERNRQWAKLRYGVRVPVNTGSDQYTYRDVGTNIDCVAFQHDEGNFRLDLSVERSSVTLPNATGKETEWKPGDNTPAHPLIRSFRDEFTVVVKNGQTIEGTSAVDPVTGHVLKIDVTLNVLK